MFNENKIRVEISKKRPGPGIPSSRRSDSIRGAPPVRSNPNFRTGNSTPFKPKPRFLNSSSNSRTGTGAPRLSQGAPRFSRGGRMDGGGAPRFSDSTTRFSGSSPNERSYSSNSSSRFPSSRSGVPRFGGQPSAGGPFSSGGYKGSNFRSRPMDK